MGKRIDKIRVSAGEDLLAFIPHMLGYWPERSIVCIGMSGKCLRATMRLDLPPEDLDDAPGFAALAASQLASDSEADGCLVAIFGIEDWDVPGGLPQAALFHELRRAFGKSRLPIRDAWYVGPQHWRSLECADASCCSWPGRDNAAIRESFVNTEFIYRGSMVRESPQQQIQAMVAGGDEEFAAKVAAAGQRFQAVLPTTGSGAHQLAVTLGAWELALQHWPQRPDPDMAAFLLASLGQASVRDAVLVALATDPNAAFAGAAGTGCLQPDSGPIEAPATWYGGNQAEGWQATIADDSDEAVIRVTRDFGNILVGEISFGDNGEPLGPDWMRLGQAEHLLQFLAGATSTANQAPVLCLLGWIEWCKGRGTWAGNYFQLCLAKQPGYRLAELLDRLLSVGYVAACAKDPRTAWRGRHDAEPGGLDEAA